jgi:hypothetical protein
MRLVRWVIDTMFEAALSTINLSYWYPRPRRAQPAMDPSSLAAQASFVQRVWHTCQRR